MSEMQNNERAVALLTAVLSFEAGSPELCDLLLELWPSLCALKQAMGRRTALDASSWTAVENGMQRQAHDGLMDAMQRYFEVHGHSYQSIFAHEEKKDG